MAAIPGVQSPPSWLPRTAGCRRSLAPPPATCLRRRPLTGICSLVAQRRLPEAEEEAAAVVRTLLIDNYDSYTYNIYQELSVVNGVPPVVIRNDEWTWEYIAYCLYEKKIFDNIVISPGPGSPTCPMDIGICLEVLRECKDIPILGICLGHQALGFVHGAQIVHAPEPVHGRLSEIEHGGCSLFHHIPSGRNSGFKVVRYHSLVIDADSLPKDLMPIAWTASLHAHSSLGGNQPAIGGPFCDSADQLGRLCSFSNNSNEKRVTTSSDLTTSQDMKVLMGVMHCTWPHYGVQFHPESIATSHGRQIFVNFRKMTIEFGLGRSAAQERKMSHIDRVSYLSKNELLYCKDTTDSHLLAREASLHTHRSKHLKELRLQWRKIDNLLSRAGGAEKIFCHIFGDNNAKDTFWLDSSSANQSRARFSFMGGRGGPLWKQITFRLADQDSDSSHNVERKCKLAVEVGGYLSIQDVDGFNSTKFLKDGFFEFLEKEICSFQYDKRDFEGLPFDFYGGFVGFLGYGLKVECGASSNRHKSTTPDACFFFVDNFVVIDHSNGDVYILSLQDTHGVDSGDGLRKISEKKSWLVETEKRLLRLNAMISKVKNVGKPLARPSVVSKQSFSVEKTKYQYIRDVEKCLKFIRDGESYELCLTTQLRKRIGSINHLRLYLSLRAENPAPYAAWLNFSSENLCICCSSPERFLRLDGNGILEAKPIKGTISRGRTPEEDERLRLQLQYSQKDQAENLMIVDLLRNDLGRVCEPGSVHVPHLMAVESYATVHTMVSTIKGRKRPDLSPIECVRAAFPGGSMTGAPKIRSMELLDSLESCARGIYAGSIGFFSYNHTFDLNIVIRTIVIHNTEASVGAGGAIIALSKPEDEYNEMVLKAKAPTEVVEKCCREDVCAGSYDMVT